MDHLCWWCAVSAYHRPKEQHRGIGTVQWSPLWCFTLFCLEENMSCPFCMNCQVFNSAFRLPRLRYQLRNYTFTVYGKIDNRTRDMEIRQEEGGSITMVEETGMWYASIHITTHIYLWWCIYQRIRMLRSYSQYNTIIVTICFYCIYLKSSIYVLTNKLYD